jgi:hypothetical protein
MMERGEQLAREMFPAFELIDADETYFAVRLPGIGRIDARVDQLGVEKISVEKFGSGERTRLFRGANLKVKAEKYLGL